MLNTDISGVDILKIFEHNSLKTWLYLNRNLWTNFVECFNSFGTFKNKHGYAISSGYNSIGVKRLELVRKDRLIIH